MVRFQKMDLSDLRVGGGTKMGQYFSCCVLVRHCFYKRISHMQVFKIFCKVKRLSCVQMHASLKHPQHMHVFFWKFCFPPPPSGIHTLILDACSFIADFSLLVVSCAVCLDRDKQKTPKRFQCFSVGVRLSSEIRASVERGVSA